MKNYSPEVKERAVRLVLECQDDHPSEWAAIQSIALKVGYWSRLATYRRWKLKRRTIANSTSLPAWHDSNEMASGKPGTVHCVIASTMPYVTL